MGILKLARKDPGQALIYKDWLDNNVMKAFSGRILPFDTNAALRGIVPISSKSSVHHYNQVKNNDLQVILPTLWNTY